MNYKSVWWCLFNCPSSSEWRNSLLGKVERAFSHVNLIKATKRSSLCQKSLDNLVSLNADKCPLQDFSADSSIDLWWGAKQRRPSHRPRKHYKKWCSKGKGKLAGDSQPSLERDVVVLDDEEIEYDADGDGKEDGQKFVLDDWDEWVL